MCFFSQRLFLKEPTKQDEIQDVIEVCGLGLCAVYVGYFPFPRFYGYIELTPYIFMYIFSFLLVPGWHLECPHHLFFSKPSGAESQVFKTESVSELFIYTHSCLFIETHCSQELLDIIYIYLSIYMCLCLDAGIIHRKLAGSTKSSGQTGFRSTEICQKGSQHCGGFGWWHVMDTFFGFCNDFADTGKTENTENAGNTHYTHLKDQFFCVHMYCSMLM